MLAKEGLLHRLVVKALLYPEFMRRLNIESVRLRRNHQTTSFRRRQSICSSSGLSRNESESNAGETSATSSISFVRYFPNKLSNESSGSEKTFLDHGPGVDVDCTREIFVKIETLKREIENKVHVKRARDGSLTFTHANCGDGDIGRDSLKYYTKPVKVVIDRGRSTESLIHTTTAQMFIGGSADVKDTEKGSPTDDSVLSEFNQRPLRANMACEDLVNLDESMNIEGDSKKPATIDERHSMPTPFVGNRFNCSSLTEVFIPSYAEKREMKTSDKDSNPDCTDDTNKRHSNTSTTTTHSSSVDIPPLVPAPDKLSIELMYNLNNSPSENPDTHHIVIKPPSMFDSRRTSNKVDTSNNPIEHRSISQCNLPNILRLEAGDKRTISFEHYANDQDDSFRLPHNIQNSDKTLSPKKKCGCCVQSHSPTSQRSSDSGMAGSCTISPDAPILNTENEYDPLDERFLPDIQQRLNSLMYSHSSHNFGQFENHDSGQYGCNDESESEQHRDSNAVKNMFELSSSQDTVRRKSRCQSAEPQIEPQIEPQTEQQIEPQIDPQTEINATSSTELPKTYKTGMYAHWWKKTQLPSAILKDICRSKLNKKLNPSSSQLAPSNTSRGSGKPIFVLDLVVFSLCSAHYVLLYALTILLFFCLYLSHPVECTLRLPSFKKFHIFFKEISHCK